MIPALHSWLHSLCFFISLHFTLLKNVIVLAKLFSFHGAAVLLGVLFCLFDGLSKSSGQYESQKEVKIIAQQGLL